MPILNSVRSGTFALAMVVGLTACSQGLVIQGGFAPLGQVPLRDQLSAVNAKGPVLVEVTGPALGADPDDIAAAIATAVDGIPAGLNISYTADPDAAGLPNYRVVYGFDVPNSVGSFAVCDPSSYSSTQNPAGADRLKLVVAFCYKDEAQSSQIVRTSALDGVGTSAFQSVIQKATFNLFRPGRDDRTGGPYDNS